MSKARTFRIVKADGGKIVGEYTLPHPAGELDAVEKHAGKYAKFVREDHHVIDVTDEVHALAKEAEDEKQREKERREALREEKRIAELREENDRKREQLEKEERTRKRAERAAAVPPPPHAQPLPPPLCVLCAMPEADPIHTDAAHSQKHLFTVGA